MLCIVVAFAINEHESATGVHVSPILDPPFCNKLITGQACDQSALTSDPPSSQRFLLSKSHARRLCRAASSVRAETWMRLNCRVRGCFWWLKGKQAQVSTSGAWERPDAAASCPVLSGCTRNAHRQRAFLGGQAYESVSALGLTATPGSLLLCLFLSSSTLRETTVASTMKTPPFSIF